MLIGKNMNTDELLKLMEDGSPIEAAQELRDLLMEAGYAGTDTSTVPNILSLMDDAMHAAYDRIHAETEVNGYLPGGITHRNGVHVD